MTAVIVGLSVLLAGSFLFWLHVWHQDKVIEAFAKGCMLGRQVCTFSDEEMALLLDGGRDG